MSATAQTISPALTAEDVRRIFREELERALGQDEVSADEAARILRISRDWLLDLAGARTIKSQKRGKFLYFKRADLSEYDRARTRKSKAEIRAEANER